MSSKYSDKMRIKTQCSMICPFRERLTEGDPGVWLQYNRHTLRIDILFIYKKIINYFIVVVVAR